MRAEKHGIFVHLLARGLPHRYAEPPPGGGLGYVPAVHLDYDDFEGVLCPYSEPPAWRVDVYWVLFRRGEGGARVGHTRVSLSVSRGSHTLAFPRGKVSPQATDEGHANGYRSAGGDVRYQYTRY